MKNFLFAAVSGLALITAFEVNAETNQQGQSDPVDTIEVIAIEDIEAPAKPDQKASKHSKARTHHQAVRAHQAAQARLDKRSGFHPAYPNHPLGIRAELPLLTLKDCGSCQVEYYGSHPDCAYQYYGGYFWYPHTAANVLSGYVPHSLNGRYWYASHMHPHMVYVQRAPLIFVHPVPMHAYPIGGVPLYIDPSMK